MLYLKRVSSKYVYTLKIDKYYNTYNIILFIYKIK